MWIFFYKKTYLIRRSKAAIKHLHAYYQARLSKDDGVSSKILRWEYSSSGGPNLRKNDQHRPVKTELPRVCLMDTRAIEKMER